MRGYLVGGLLVVAASLAVVAAAGTAGASSDAASLAALVDETQRQLGRLAAVQRADGQTNIIRAVGGLGGLGVGVAVGSVATYAQWRR